MIPLFHLNTLSQLRSLTVEDLIRAQSYLWDDLHLEVSTSDFAMLLHTISFHPSLKYRLESLSYKDSLLQVFPRGEIPFNCHTLRPDSCHKEDVCLTFCRWRPPSQRDSLEKETRPLVGCVCVCVGTFSIKVKPVPPESWDVFPTSV